VTSDDPNGGGAAHPVAGPPAAAPAPPPARAPSVRPWIIGAGVLVILTASGLGGVLIGHWMGPLKPAPPATSAAPVAAAAPSASPAAASNAAVAAASTAVTDANGIPLDQENNPSWQQCNAEDPATVITGCTAIITASNESPRDMAVAYNDRGYGYNANGQAVLAIPDLNKAIQLDPPNATNPYINLGYAELDLGDYKDATAAFNNAIGLSPNDADIYKGVGDNYAVQQDWTDAITSYTKAIQLDGSQTDAYVARGWALRAMKQLPQALADFTSAVQIDASDEEAIRGQGQVLVAENLCALAIAAFNKAISLDNQDALAWYGRAEAELGLQNQTAAAVDIAEANKLDPSVANSPYVRN
jgi:tetratricopeptide (TPR) repeat protein